MTDIQKKLLELLTDIDDICKRYDIKYYLCKDTAHAAIMTQAFYQDGCCANIAMTTDNVLKFIEAVKKENRKDRIVDSMLTNKSYPDFTVNYGDPNTMMIKIPYLRKGKIPCMAVTIHMIRYKPNRAKKYYKKTRKFWKLSHKKLHKCKNFSEKFTVLYSRVVAKIFGEHYIGRHLFKKWCAIFSANKKAEKISICAGKFHFDSELLDYEDTVMLEGKEFPVFGYVDAYLNKHYRRSNFRKIMPKYEVPSSALLVSPFVPYDKYLQKAKEAGINFAAIYRNRLNCTKLEEQVSEDNKKIDRYYAVVDRTQKRFAMYEKYIPMKKLLLKLHSEGRYEELNELLKPYRSALWSCYRKEMGLCFDKEIFEMTMDILKSEGSYTYVKKLRAMVPESHLEPMQVTDYKGELVEITDISELLPEYADKEEEPLQ